MAHLQHTFAVIGPYAEWEYIGKISASIPCQRIVKDHVEGSINHFHRGKSHTSPDKEEDIACLQASYEHSKIHRYIPGRKLSAKSKAPDFISLGEGAKLMKVMDNWIANCVSEWSTAEEWKDDSDDSDN